MVAMETISLKSPVLAGRYFTISTTWETLDPSTISDFSEKEYLIVFCLHVKVSKLFPVLILCEPEVFW